MSSLEIVLLILGAWVIGLAALSGVWMWMVNRSIEERDDFELWLEDWREDSRGR